MNIKNIAKHTFVLMLALSVVGIAVAKTVREKHDNGKKKLVYNVNKAGENTALTRNIMKMARSKFSVNTKTAS